MIRTPNPAGHSAELPATGPESGKTGNPAGGKTPRRLMFIMLVLALLTAACSSGGNTEEADGEPVTLKVLYWNDQSFYSEYGMPYYALNPDVEFEVVNTSKIRVSEGESYLDKLDAFIREEQPDILVLDLEQYEKFANDGRLVSFEPYLNRDKVDLDGFVPGLIELMRSKGGGELYGLTPHFSSQALYYNKDLFDRYGIDYPTDKMSWEDLFNLAARFPTDGSDEDRVYGLNIGYYTDLFQLGQRIGMSLGLREVNPADMRVLVDSDSWARVYELALGAMRSGALYKIESTSFEGGYDEFLLRDPFISGKAAMTIDGAYLMQQIREAQDYIPDKAVKNWDLVTVPVDPANPDYTNDVWFYNIFAINADSANRDAAWDFIRYLHSDDYARVMSKILNGTFPVRTKYIRDDEGRNLAAFYLLKPADTNMYARYGDLPDDFFTHYYEIGTEEMQAVLEDRKTVAEALASMQTRLQAALDEALANRAEGANEQNE
ncbi:MAG: hypothetical protein A9Z00_08430 [Thermobacillus sp. ZCTH02-B1]|uniref:ABC transporter substrate-binding protein n=1 Tax=Thermobacillus sp. ZCTH02-B1 TaxID=1858795 RepID=UPI000B564054|nr:extracellular solute-binding protein [Thermobacillus sp. ZCTH02-B1]OUM95370.1 MAG: hypothetical protein A9Z00_08430 [Thermobacillus sp. ZCTH02-B1]